MNKACYFIKKNPDAPSLTKFDFSDQNEKNNEDIKEEQNDSLADFNNNEKSDSIIDPNISSNDDKSSKNNKTEQAIKNEQIDDNTEKFAEDQEERNNILSIQLENWLCSGY